MTDQLDRELRELARTAYDAPPDAGALLACLSADEERRVRRTRRLLLPVLLAVSAGAGYAAARWTRTVPAHIELRVDGGERFDAGTFELVLDEDGRPRPIHVPVGDRGTVELSLELPEGFDPATMQGVRFLAEVSTDPDPESDE